MPEDQKRDQILDAALAIMQTYGVKKFTQPQVAKAAGIRQSLLTYYFPKKIDLILGLLESHERHASAESVDVDLKGKNERLASGLKVISSDKGRMRFFLSLILEAQLEPELLQLVDAHMSKFDAKVAEYFGRRPGDLDVVLFLSSLRGLGVRNLVSHETQDVDIEEIASRFGLATAAD